MPENSSPTYGNFMNGLSLPEAEAALQGENPFVFRVAAAKSEPKSSPSVRVEGPYERLEQEIEGIEPEFSIHEAVTGQPFSATYLRLDDAWKHLGNGDRGRLHAIDGYVRELMIERHLQDTPGAAISVIKELESEAGLTELHDPYYRAERLAALAKEKEGFDRVERFKKRLAAGSHSRDPLGRFS